MDVLATPGKQKLRYEEFKDRIEVDVLEEAIEFEPIESKGGNDIGYCPLPNGWHKNGDSTGKFAIHRDKKVYNCWVCGGGSLLSLAMEVNDMSVDEATDWLYQFTKPYEELDSEFVERIRETLYPEAEPNIVMPWFNPRVLEKWTTDHWWFEERGISERVVAEYQLGYDHQHVRRTNRGEYTGQAVILPHFWGGKLVGYQERWLEDQETRPRWVPKYTNTVDFPRKETLFNFNQVALQPMPPIICESVPTVLMLESLTIPAIATFGSNTSHKQMLYLRRFQQGIVLAPDNDPAGTKWADSLTEYLRDYIVVTVLDPVPGKGSDLGDFKADPDALWDHIGDKYEHHVTTKVPERRRD